PFPPASFPTRRSSDLAAAGRQRGVHSAAGEGARGSSEPHVLNEERRVADPDRNRTNDARSPRPPAPRGASPDRAGGGPRIPAPRSEEHTSELQSRENL